MAAGVFFYIITFGTKSFTTGTIKADTIPKALAVILFGLGVCIVLRWVIITRKNQKAGQSAPEMDNASESAAADDPAAEKPSRKNAIYQKATTPITLVLIFLYIFIMNQLGFVISTVLYLSAQITLLSTELSWKSFLKSFVVALIAAILIFLIFGKAFKLPLPINDFGF